MQYKNQAGFTLVEIAIVLVIIGLLLGGVLKGQELIDNSRVKTAVADMNGVTAAVNAYRDRYRRTPGDDGPVAQLTARGGNWTTVTVGGDNNGIPALGANPFAPAAGGEGTAFWQHLRAAGLITGNAALAGAAAVPRNPFNGLMGVAQAAAATTYPVQTLIICHSNVPGKNAQAIDAAVDDGLPGTGDVRSTQGANNAAPGAPAPAYDEANMYTVCRTL